MKLKHLLLIAVSICILFSCKQKISKEEGEKQLKAFDNEVILISKNFSKTLAFQALQQLINIEKLPLPFQYKASEAIPGKPYDFNFDKLKGVYRYDKLNNEFYKSAAADSIILVYPFYTEKDSVATFILSDYSEELSAWNIFLPTKLNVQIKISDKVIAQITCTGEIKHQIPVDYQIEAKLSNFNIQSKLHTSLTRKRGKINIETTITKDQNQLVTNKLKFETTMNSEKQIVFNAIDSKLNVFPLYFDMHIDRNKIAPKTTHFIDDFNQNSSIMVYGNAGKNIVGQIKLADRPNNDRLNVAVVYNDGTIGYLDDFLFSAKEILNIKL